MDEEYDFIDLERGPPPPLQRINTSDTEQLVTSRKRLDDLLKADRERPLTIEEVELEFAKGSPSTRQAREREAMSDEDVKDKLRYQNLMDRLTETGGRRRTHRKRHYKKKTLKKRGKTNRNYKKRSSKRSRK